MIRRLLSLFLAFMAMLSLLPTAVFAASSEGNALGEVDIYSGDYELGYLVINGTVRKRKYAYFLYESNDGSTKESPAYCANPSQYDMPRTIGPGESIRYLTEGKTSDPRAVGIISNGYPHRSLGELSLENRYQAFYATKMALWYYLILNWDISNLKMAPSLSGNKLDVGNRILVAAKDICKRGTTYSYMLTPRVTVTADKSTAYPVAIDDQTYLQQVFAVWSETWMYDYDASVASSDPDSMPEGTKIVDANNEKITAITTKYTSDGYTGTFKIPYPADSVEGQSNNVQFSLSAPVTQYAATYAVCQKKDQCGDLQNYICDLDNKIQLDVAAIGGYADSGEPDPDGTAPKTVKLEEGTEIPLKGAMFSVYDPEGKRVGSFPTGPDGAVTILLTLEGHYTITEEIPPRYHLLPEGSTQHADVEYNKTATPTFWNILYGSLRAKKRSDTGDAFSGVTIQIKRIETSETRTGQTRNGVIVFDELIPGGWEVRELAGIDGWVADAGTVQAVAVVSGEESTTTIVNKEPPGLRIIKYERDSMELMPGVSSEIFRDAESLGIFQTDQFGEILLTNCEPGTYHVEGRDTGEDNHVLDTTPQEVELKAGGGIRELVFFNDRLPDIHLIKVNSVDLSQPIANTRFRIEAVGSSWGPGEYTILEDGTIDLSKLPVGAYAVTELECPGYVVDNTQRIIHLGGDEQARFVFTDSKPPSPYLYKESAGGTPLGDATYRLTKIENGSRYLNRTTRPGGSICWEGLGLGVYSLQEVSTASDHILDSTECHVELFPGKNTTICLQNNRRPNLTIHKSDASTGAPVPGTVFLVKGTGGHSMAGVTIEPDGSTTVENLLPGAYEVSEKSVPSPYLPDVAPQLITLYSNRDRDVYLENHKRPTATIQKEDSITHDPIQYAEFHITWSSNKTQTGEQRGLDTLQTDEAGQIALEGVEDGWLTIGENKPAPSYQLPETPVTEVYVKGGENKTVTIPNIPLFALMVYKQDSMARAGISGYRFQLKYLGGEVSGSGGTVVGTYTTSADSSFIVTGLRKGYYICEELESDSGHVIDATPQSFYISERDQDIVTLYLSNTPRRAVLVRKVSAADNTPLSDVEFLVTKSDGFVVGNSNGKSVTDSTGTFLVEGVEPGTTLVIKRARAKSGYLLGDAPQTVQVREGQTVTVEFRNQPMGNLTIHKLSNKGKTPLEGVQFKITYANSSYLPDKSDKLSSNGLHWTNTKGRIALSGITGTVVVAEVESISGYTIDPDTQSQTVVVNPDDTQQLYFYNAPTDGVELAKVSDTDRTGRTPNTTFGVRRVSDDTLVDTVTAGRSRKVYLPLESGDYYAVETEAADRFRLDDMPIYFTVKDGEITRKTTTNAPFSGTLLHKVLTVDGGDVPGMSFILYDSSHNPIDQYTSDNRGYIYISDLTESGRYYLRELENKGYTPDIQLRTVYIKTGETTEVIWENTLITGQIQITKRSANYNPTTGLPAGTPLGGAIFETHDKSDSLAGAIRSNSRDLAMSGQPPLSRYTIREVKAPEHYGVSETELTAYLEYESQIARFEVTNKSLTTGVSTTRTGPKEIMGDQPVHYTFSDVTNTSNARLNNFYQRDTTPTQIRLDAVVTGTYSLPSTYKTTYRVNGEGYRTLVDNLNTSQTYALAASPAALGLAADERVAEIVFVFGQAPAGLTQVGTPYLNCTTVVSLPANSSLINAADMGGVYNETWVQAISRWVTMVYSKPGPFPRTGY